MTEENNTKETPIRDEFEALGKNIQEALQTAWDSDERKKVQADIESGLREIGDTLDRFLKDIQSSETGQQIREDVEDLGDRIRNGEVADKTREGLLQTLQNLNAKFEKAATPENSEQAEDVSEEA